MSSAYAQDDPFTEKLTSLETAAVITADDASQLLGASMPGPSLYRREKNVFRKLMRKPDEATRVKYEGVTYDLPPLTAPAQRLVTFILKNRSTEDLWLQGRAEMHTLVRYAHINDVSESSFDNSHNHFFYHDWLEVEQGGDAASFRAMVDSYVDQVSSAAADGTALSDEDIAYAISVARDSLAYVDSIRDDRMPDDIYEGLAPPALD
ncbi:hypothetical protein FF098_013735 [Parvularcula flava]|uniref:Uncharacterized protein n=1 Tax=Aquisalinus luteolus TaxID=1566827 RepID=A0ABX0HNZ1_9PROT|nr:hypothetical protein [Aquisalinus luteolus]NHK28979.1 hypothetical protein [Aquisalinus luteolus]